MKESTRISIASSTIIKIIIWLFVAAALFYMSNLVVSILVAVVLASAIQPAVRFFEKYRIPRSISILSLFICIIAVIGLIAFIFVPPIADDIATFVKQIPALLESIRIFGRDLGLKDLAAYISELSKDISKGQILTVVKNIVLGQRGLFATTSIVLTGVVNTVVTFVIAFYLALEERGVERFLRIILPIEYENDIKDIWARAEKKMSMWIQGQFLLSVIVALMIFVPMSILDMPYAALLGVFGFFGELIPVVGLTFATIPALIIAWTHGGPALFISVAIIYFIVSQLENHVLYPKIMNRAVGVPTVLIIISMLIGAKLAGFWGIILAVPLAAVAMEVLSDYDKRKRTQ